MHSGTFDIITIIDMSWQEREILKKQDYLKWIHDRELNYDDQK